MEDLVLPFLGNRNYLHGTTLLTTLLEHMPPVEHFAFRISRPILSNHIHIADSVAENCDAHINSPAMNLYVRKLSPREPIRREEFDENAITSSLCENDGNFSLASSPYPLIPSLIAMCMKGKQTTPAAL